MQINFEAFKNITLKLTDTTKLLAVSKTQPVSKILDLYNIGQKDFGENKVQDLFLKADELKEHKDISWHFIGKLQKNKINKLLSIPSLKYIHSIDSLDLLEKLLSKRPFAQIGLFLQINTSLEAEKSGFEDQSEIEKAIELINNHPKFYIKGLMTIGKIRTDHFENDARICFQKMNDLKDILEQKYRLNLQLSMGMSQDYEIAITYGSNWIRIGSLIFGQRT